MDHANEIPASGAVPARGMAAVLDWCATQRFTGVLTHEDEGAQTVIPLRAGMVDANVSSDLETAYLRLRDATRGTYALTEALPPLESASSDHPLRREGSLGPATLADLLRWCEDVALSGTVHLSVDRPTPRTHVFRYDRGELGAIELEAWSQDDLGPVFALDHGRFVVRMRSRYGVATPSHAPPADDARARLDALRAVRHGLEDLLSRRDAASSGRWRRASVRPPPASIPPPPAVPRDLAPRAKADVSGSSVVVYYLDHRPGAARKASSSDRTERLPALEAALAEPRPRAVTRYAVGLLCALLLGVGLAAGIDLLRG